MASNYTENYGLCQWDATDQVLREEFNQDHAKIDETLKILADKDITLERAVTAVASAAGNCQMELITYTGTGTPDAGNAKQIAFAHLPDIFIISGDLAIMIGQGGHTKALLIADDPLYHQMIINYATVQWQDSQILLTNSAPRYQMNTQGIEYWALGLYTR